jgi:hypothetical protein
MALTYEDVYSSQSSTTARSVWHSKCLLQKHTSLLYHGPAPEKLHREARLTVFRLPLHVPRWFRLCRSCWMDHCSHPKVGSCQIQMQDVQAVDTLMQCSSLCSYDELSRAASQGTSPATLDQRARIAWRSVGYRAPTT